MTTEERKSPFRAMLKAFDPKQAAAENRERTRRDDARQPMRRRLSAP
jgi:hypothetical protein